MRCLRPPLHWVRPSPTPRQEFQLPSYWDDAQSTFGAEGPHTRAAWRTAHPSGPPAAPAACCGRRWTRRRLRRPREALRPQTSSWAGGQGLDLSSLGTGASWRSKGEVASGACAGREQRQEMRSQACWGSRGAGVGGVVSMVWCGQ